MRMDILNRYGFYYDRTRNPELVPFPQAKPLYSDKDMRSDSTLIAEHGEWCASKCVYPQNEARINSIIQEATRG